MANKREALVHIIKLAIEQIIFLFSSWLINEKKQKIIMIILSLTDYSTRKKNAAHKKMAVFLAACQRQAFRLILLIFSHSSSI